jgi:hypothetical protein
MQNRNTAAGFILSKPIAALQQPTMHFQITIKTQRSSVFLISPCNQHDFNPLTLNDLQRSCAVSPLKIKISSKYMYEKPTNAQLLYSVY